MRAVRLRSHAIGNYIRPQIDAPLTTLVLASIAAAGVFLPWAEGFRWSKHGWSYNHGLIALVTAIEAAIVYALRAAGAITRRQYFAFGLAFALAGLGATLWFYLDIVGSNDPVMGLFSLFRPVQKQGAIGLYVTMAGFVGQLIVMAWHADDAVQRRLRAALRSPWTAAAVAGVAAAGVFRPWAEFLTWEGASRSVEPGWSFNEGLVALVAASAAAIVCILRVSGRVRLLPYAFVGLACAMMGLGAVAWFHNDAVSHIKPTGYPLVVWWLNAPRSETGMQESVSAAGFIGLIAVLSWQLWQGRREFR